MTTPGGTPAVSLAGGGLSKASGGFTVLGISGPGGLPLSGLAGLTLPSPATHRIFDDPAFLVRDPDGFFISCDPRWQPCSCKVGVGGERCYDTFVKGATAAAAAAAATAKEDAEPSPAATASASATLAAILHAKGPAALNIPAASLAAIATSSTPAGAAAGGETRPPESTVKPLYHVARLEPGSPAFKDIQKEFSTPGFEVHSIIEVQNPVLHTQYCARRVALRCLRGNENEKIAYHVSKGSPHDICQTGLDYRLAQRGFFGKGLYVTSDPMKANDYSVDKGSSTALRMMLRCKVLLGRPKHFEVGRFDRDLVAEPEGGFDSVEGFIRRGTEYVVYSSDRIYISHIVFYRFSDSKLELTPSFALPPNVTGQIVYITASLSEFFGKLQQRATADQQVPIKRLIAALLKRSLSVPDFLTQISTLLKAAPPADLKDKLEVELEKCKLPPGLAAGAGAGATATASPADAATSPANAATAGSTTFPAASSGSAPTKMTGTDPADVTPAGLAVVPRAAPTSAATTTPANGAAGAVGLPPPMAAATGAGPLFWGHSPGSASLASLPMSVTSSFTSGALPIGTGPGTPLSTAASAASAFSGGLLQAPALASPMRLMRSPGAPALPLSGTNSPDPGAIAGSSAFPFLPPAPPSAGAGVARLGAPVQLASIAFTLPTSMASVGAPPFPSSAVSSSGVGNVGGNSGGNPFPVLFPPQAANSAASTATHPSHAFPSPMFAGPSLPLGTSPSSSSSLVNTSSSPPVPIGTAGVGTGTVAGLPTASSTTAAPAPAPYLSPLANPAFAHGAPSAPSLPMSMVGTSSAQPRPTPSLAAPLPGSTGIFGAANSQVMRSMSVRNPDPSLGAILGTGPASSSSPYSLLSATHSTLPSSSSSPSSSAMSSYTFVSPFVANGNVSAPWAPPVARPSFGLHAAPSAASNLPPPSSYPYSSLSSASLSNPSSSTASSSSAFPSPASSTFSSPTTSNSTSSSASAPSDAPMSCGRQSLVETDAIKMAQQAMRGGVGSAVGVHGMPTFASPATMRSSPSDLDAAGASGAIAKRPRPSTP